MITKLKVINQSVRPSRIKQSISGFILIKKLYEDNEKLIKLLDLSREATKYWVKLQKRGKSELGVGIAVNFFYVIEKYPAIIYLTQMAYPCRMIMFYAFIFWYI